MKELGIKRRYFSIKWQAFSLTSLVLALIFAAFLVFISESTLRQFEIGRSHVYEQNKQQLDNLIEVAAEKVIQFAQTSTLHGKLAESLRNQDNSGLQEHLDNLSWRLQVDAGVEDISVFDHLGQLQGVVGIPAEVNLVEKIFRTEAPQWNVRCLAKCFVEGGTPILGNGEVVGAVILSEPLSNVMLRFQHISNIDTGLLTDNASLEEFDSFIPSWEKNLVALTNPKSSKEIITNASTLYTLQELQEGVRLIDINSEVFELRALPIQENQVVVILNVSKDIVNMEQSREESIRISVISLIVAEFVLLILLWRPMTRLRKTAKSLPLLAERRFDDARECFEDLKSLQFFNDETDLLNVTALRLSTELESLQDQLETRAEQLEARGRELEKERDFVNQLLDTVHAIIIIQDEAGQIQLSNKFAVRLSGYSARELKGKPFSSLFGQTAETDRIATQIRDVVDGNISEYQHEAVLNARDGSQLHLAWRHAVLYNHDSDTRQVLSVAVDISARVKAESEIAWLATHDTLSGLYNRYRFEEELERNLVSFKRNQSSLGVLYIDLDNFKQINDQYGHHKGDELIQKVANVLKQNARESDFVARLGGDEFALILRDFEDTKLSDIAQRFLSAIGQIYLQGDSYCSASMGLAVMDSCIPDADALMIHADKAMYQAKALGKNHFVIFDSRTDDNGQPATRH